MSEQGMGTGVDKGMGRRRLIAAAAAVAAAVATRTVSAQAPPAKDGAGSAPASGGIGPRYAAGTADTVYQNLGGASFIPSSSATTYAFQNAGGIAATANGAFYAPLDLPQGATITELTFALYHNVTTTTALVLYRFDANGHTVNLGGVNYTTQSGSIVNVAVPLSGSLTVDNSLYTYVAYWLPGTYSGSDSLYGARVGYTLPGMAQVFGAAANGIGVHGESGSSIGVQGISTSGNGVSGTSDTGFGLEGITTHGYGIVGRAGATSIAALYGTSTNVNAPAFAAYNAIANGLAGTFNGQVQVNGAFTVTGGAKSAAVPHPDGTYRLLYCVESPESWFEDFGEGTISGGKAEVKLDPDFAAVVNTSKLHVFLTPHDDAHHLAVTNRASGGFSVSAVPSAPAHAAGRKAGDLSGTFTYRVVAKRKDIPGERLAKFTPHKTPPPPDSRPPQSPSLPPIPKPPKQ